MFFPKSLLPAGVVSVLLLVPSLHAQDFFNGGVTARTAGSAGVYVPAIGSALDALSVNPAGLSHLNGRVAELSAFGLLARGSFSNATNNDSPMRFNAGAMPFGAFGMPLGQSRWTVAAGFLPDLLSSSKWQFNDAPGTAGANYGPQREKSAILAFRIPVGVSYRVNSRLSVGATVSAIYNSNTLVMPYVFQSHPALAGLKTLLDLHTTGAGWNTSFGVVAKASKHVELSASYRTRSSITSSGKATGDLSSQFAAVGLNAPSTFRYRAQVNVEIPQAAVLGVSWQKSPVLRLSAETSWTGWRDSFYDLPVSLTAGSNPAINGLLNSSSLADTVPLHWKDQYSFRFAAQRLLTERLAITGGFAHANSPVPSSTLSPLTAAIMRDGLATGLGYDLGRSRFDLAYQFNFNHQQSVGTSTLLAGEFSHSRVDIGTQALTLSTSFHF